MPPFIPALCLVGFMLYGKRSVIIPTDDGYILREHTALWRYEIDVAEPQVGHGDICRFDGGPNVRCDLWFRPVLVTETREESFIRRDALTLKEIAAFELSSISGPLTEWKVKPPIAPHALPSEEYPLPSEESGLNLGLLFLAGGLYNAPFAA